MKSTDKQKCKEQLKKLNGLPPYNSPLNFVAHDNFFAQSIKDEFDDKLIDECEKELGI